MTDEGTLLEKSGWRRPWMSTGMSAAFVVLGLLAGPAVASAADGSQAPTDDDASVGGPLSGELDDYWSVDRDVDIVKNKLYRREGRFGAGGYLGLMSSEPFFWYNPVGARVSYWFTDQLGIEVTGSYMGDSPVINQETGESLFQHRTELTSFLANEERAAPFNEDRQTLDQFRWRAHAAVTWHPLYGKLALLQRKLAHFDLNLTAGLGAVQVQRPTPSRDASTTVVTPELMLGGGVHFFATESLVLRLDGRGYTYKGPTVPSNADDGFLAKLEFPTEFLLGVTYMF